jgi:TrmH family RNA methyltransferase
MELFNIITSTQNEKVKLAYGLQNRARSRRKEMKIALEGVKLVRDALERGHKPTFIMYDPEAITKDVIKSLKKHAPNNEYIAVSPEVMQHIAEAEQPQGLLGVFPLPMPPLPRNPTRVLILDEVSDPGNMGTIFRTAAASGVDCVLLTPNCADPYNPKVLRSGMGAHFRLPIIEVKWFEIENYCQSLKVYVAMGEGEMRYDKVDWRESWALIIGNEGHGVSEQSLALASAKIHIPMAKETESLNAGIATGVILFEAARQRFVG